MIGFDTSGRLSIQTLGNNGLYATSLIFGTVSLYNWTHVGMTYSIANGIQLFVNGSLANKNNTYRSYTASGQMNTLIIGSCVQWSACALNQTQIVPSQFRGKIDELKIFSRELSVNEVQQLAQG